MTENELLMAKFDVLDKQIELVKERVTKVEMMLENEMLPRIQSMEACYVGTYRRYQASIEQLDAMQSDLDIVKMVVQEHSEKLQTCQGI